MADKIAPEGPRPDSFPEDFVLQFFEVRGTNGVPPVAFPPGEWHVVSTRVGKQWHLAARQTRDGAEYSRD